MQFALTLAGVLVLAHVVHHLAPSFGGEPDRRASLKVVAYSLTPAFLAGALMVTPAFDGIATLLGLYGVYLLFAGLPVLMRCKPEQTIAYCGVTVGAAVILSVIVGAATAFLLGALVGLG